MTAADWQALAAVRYASAREWYAMVDSREPDAQRRARGMSIGLQGVAAEASAAARKLMGVES